jgi:hypothetical protein
VRIVLMELGRGRGLGLQVVLRLALDCDDGLKRMIGGLAVRSLGLGVRI